MSTNTDIPLRLAYQHCRRIARKHYENFPVTSLLLPARLRPHVAAVYAFARIADDFADEGDDDAATRLQKLADWRAQLVHAMNDDAAGLHPVFLALRDTARRFDIPVQLFHDLLDAFVQDVTVDGYETFDDLLAYCRCSANPIGRIMLALFGALNENTMPYSDKLCTGLQLTNFWQDLSIDIRKPRVYLPRETMERYGFLRRHLLRSADLQNIREAIRFEVRRTRWMYFEAASLFALVPFRLRLQLEATWLGGTQILEMIKRQDFDVLHKRPKLGIRQYCAILWRLIYWRLIKIIQFIPGTMLYKLRTGKPLTF